MRLWYIGSTLLIVSVLAAGCAPEVLNPNGGSIIDAVAGLTDTAAGAADSGSPAPDVAPAETAITLPAVVKGIVTERGDYKLYNLGSTHAGEEWAVTAGGLLNYRSFLVVLLDADYDLLQRQVVSSNQPLRHIVRGASSAMYLGVTPAFGRAGGDFLFSIDRLQSVTVPAPRQQVAWLNFAAASDVSVHRRDGISFPAFDAGLIGAAYEDTTETMKAAIVAAMQEDYADYNLVIMTSDDGPPPDGPHATLHFGGYDNRLLGLADSVDQYNADSWESAIIYVETFSDFSVMRLTSEEMGQMIGNVASHELGHLLGLFHTQVPVDIMDTTGTAWDLAGDQSFTRGELESTVFPAGFENSPARLAETIGCCPHAKSDPVTKPVLTAKMLRKASLRAMVRDELRCRCGNCLNPDD